MKMQYQIFFNECSKNRLRKNDKVEKMVDYQGKINKKNIGER